MHAGCKIKKKYVQVKQVKMKATYGYGICRYQGICFIIVSTSVPISQIVYSVLKYDLCVHLTDKHKSPFFDRGRQNQFILS